MPDLAAYEKALPDNVQLITICIDAGNDWEGTKAFLDSCGYEGVTIVGGDEHRRPGRASRRGRGRRTCPRS